MFDAGWESDADPAPSRAWSGECPSAALVAALCAADPVEPVEDEGYDAVERVGAWEAVAAWAMAQQVETVAGLLQSRQGRAPRSSRAQQDQFAATAMELAAMVRVAPVTGEHRLEQAVGLVERLPLTLAALSEGRIAYSHARVVVEQTRDCDDEAAGAVDARFWGGPGAGDVSRTPTQVRERVRRVIQRLDPEALRRRAQQAEQGRTVRYWSDDDGATGVIALRLPADRARGVFAVIDAAAQQALDAPDMPPDQQRNLGNRRADALVDLIMTGATSAAAAAYDDDAAEPADAERPDARPADTEPADTEPADTEPADTEPGDGASSSGGACDGSCSGRASGGSRARTTVQVQVRVLVPWQTLAGRTEAPGELEGHGPIPADLARRLAAGTDAVLQRLLVDPVTGTGRHLDLTRYRPPPSLRSFVEDRDQFCHAPGCRRSARACDLDHVIAYDHRAPDGGAGRTRPAGLRPECRRHHNLKTRGLWGCELDERPGVPPGVVWTSPSGHRWIVRAPSLTEPDLPEPDLDGAATDEGELAHAA